MTVRIATWNVEWATPKMTRGQTIASILRSISADIIVLTEGVADLLPTGGHVVDGGNNWGYQVADERRRKVIMWSRNEWTNVAFGNDTLPPGRFIDATTTTPIGEVRIFGVCIPWRHAHVKTGAVNRKPWEDHLTYLQGLIPLVSENRHSLIIAGDYNQRIPRTSAPTHVFEQLSETFQDLVISTTGISDQPLIDHVAHTPDLKSSFYEIIPSSHEGQRLTDHQGIFVDLLNN